MSSSGSSRLETFAKIVAALATIIGAVFGVWKVVAPSANATQTEALKAPGETRKLIWGPTDCGSTVAEVFIGDCDAKPLRMEWLRGQLKLLKNAGIRGFAELPEELRLEARPLGGESNRLLFAEGAAREFAIGIGYDSTRDVKDGGLRISRESGVDIKGRKRFDVVSPAAFLDRANAWWVLDGEGWHFVKP